MVDDSQSTASALSALLTGAGHRVTVAKDGTEAIRLATTTDVDLVLLDVGLPGMDGFQVLRLLRASNNRRHQPVIILSVKDDQQQKVTALKLGADDFIAKPWHDEELLARIDRSLSFRRKVDELIDESSELQRLSITDGLTQVNNHRYFQERLSEEFRRAQRYDDPLALILLDLDNFKLVNDRYGHPAGDEVLKASAQVLKKCVRETDLCARYGGEEFAVLLPKTHLAGALTVAERIWKDIAQLRIASSAMVRITASLGVSGYPSRSVLSSEQLLRTADDALYRAKREGRNKICLFQQVSLYSETAKASAQS
ncbi:MAG: diguanylate cyclase [Myxococcaceae bacterium]